MNFLIFAAFAVIGIGTTQTVYGSGAAMDYDERYENIPGGPECWYDGYQDGLNHPFNQSKNEGCIDKGNQYYRAFIFGCIDANNTKEICELFTDQ